MDVDKKFDAKKFLTENPFEIDDLSAIYGSLHKLRKYLTNVDAVSQFRIAGGVGNLMILFKKYATSLISLHTKKKTVESKLDKIVYETLSLTANCCHLDRRCKLVVKNVQFLSSIVPLLQLDKLNLDIVSSAVRLLGNLCDCKESAAAVLQTKSLISTIVHWMIIKKQNNGEEKNNEETMEKIKDLSLRMFRLASSCKTSFARFLLQNDVCFHVSSFLSAAELLSTSGFKENPSSSCFKEKNPSSSCFKEKVYKTLIEMSSCKDVNFAEQLVRASVGEEIVKDARGVEETSSPSELCKLARKLLFDVVHEYSDVRIEVSKYGAIELIHDLARSDRKTMLLLSKFCRDAFTRVKLRETDALSSLIDAFADDKTEYESKKEFMNAFVCFLYDDNGIVYLLKRPILFTTFINIVNFYCKSSQCTCLHSIKTTAEENLPMTNQNECGDSNLLETEIITPLYRPDSPTYVKLQRNFDEFETNVRLCKEFHNGFPSHPNCSPGPSWSPSNSVRSFPSPLSCSSPSWSLDSADISCSLSVSDNEFELDERKEFSRSEWCTEAKHDNVDKNSFAKSLCNCGWTPETSEELTNESLLNSIVLFLSWLSHNDSYVDNLVSHENLLETLIIYVSSVCRPQPRAGRMLTRVARNRLMTEKLLKLEFHLLIRRHLCNAKCQTEPFCVYCRKLCRIGSDIISSFRTSGRRKRFLLEYNGLEIILNELLSCKDDVATKRKAFDAVRQLISHHKLKSIWAQKIGRTSFPISFPCDFSSKFLPDQSTVSFVSADGDKELKVNKQFLLDNSSFYRAMFTGDFEESSKSCLKIKGDDISFEALEIFFHFLHGCRHCPTCQTISNWRVVSDLISLSEQHLRLDLYQFIVECFVAKVLDKISCSTFLSHSVLCEDCELFEMCIVYVFLFFSAAEAFEFVSVLNCTNNERVLPLFKRLFEIFCKQFV